MRAPERDVRRKVLNRLRRRANTSQHHREHARVGLDGTKIRQIILANRPQQQAPGADYPGIVQHGTRAEPRSPRQRAILDAVRLSGIGAEPTSLILFVGLEIALEPLDVAVALE